MILPPAVDKSCRTAKICIKINSRVRKSDKALANRKFRRVLKSVVREIDTEEEWDSAVFNLPTYTSWDIW